MSLFLVAIALLAQDPYPPPPEPVGAFHYVPLGPMASLRPGLVARLPSTVGAGEVDVHLSVQWLNYWGLDVDDFRVDQEVLFGILGADWGLSKDWRLRLEVMGGGRFGGAMDDLIDGWHESTIADEFRRDEFPQDEFVVRLEDKGGRGGVSLTNRDRGGFGESLVAGVQGTLWRSGRSEVAATASARIDLGPNEDLMGGSPVDLGVSVSGTTGVGAFRFGLALDAAWYGTERWGSIRLRSVGLGLLALVEWHLVDGLTALVQYHLQQGTAEDFLDFSYPSNEILVGAKVALSGRTVLELAIMENAGNPANSPDFGLHAGLSVRF